MSMVERLAVAVAVVGLGVVAGQAIRLHRDRAGGRVDGAGGDLPSGLVLVTVPFCTRCSRLQDRLREWGMVVSEFDASLQPWILREGGVSAAPSLLVVDRRGRIRDVEARDFSAGRIRELAACVG